MKKLFFICLFASCVSSHTPKVLAVYTLQKDENGIYQRDGCSKKFEGDTVTAIGYNGKLQRYILRNGMWRKEGKQFLNPDTAHQIYEFVWLKQ